METTWAFAALSAPLLLLAAAFITYLSKPNDERLPKAISAVGAIGALGAAIFGVYGAFFGGASASTLTVGGVNVVYYDRLSAIMLLLVAFLGVVIVRYSAQYMAGQARFGYFFRWMCFTLASVLTLIISGNLLLFTVAWVATSMSLHKLLTFYPERAGALLAARKKFIISRVGDFALIAALGLTYQTFGTWNFDALFQVANAAHASGALANSGAVSAIALLFTLGAVLKSAQFPFHSWLPDTMETPTPVSALMHAGIINAGGFLILRLSPVVSLSPVALNVLAIFGAVTALFGSLVMLTQTSVKKSLAFSTVAQMGFMMLQCGLGAYAVAVLHMVAHALYKAHSFLSSGSAVNKARTLRLPAVPQKPGGAMLLAGLVLALGISYGLGTLFGQKLESGTPTGVFVLGAILAMAVTHLLWSLFGSLPAAQRFVWGAGLSAAVAGGYYALHAGFEKLLAPTLPTMATELAHSSPSVLMVIIALFGAVLLFQWHLAHWSSRPWVQALYVHASNGFYINTLANRTAQALWPIAPASKP